MTQKHTRLPWRFATAEERMGYIGCHIMGANGRPVASTVDPLSPPGDHLEDKANALLILQASNAHEELLAACEDALQWMEANLLPTDKSGFESRKLLRAAIAKATSPQAR